MKLILMLLLTIMCVGAVGYTVIGVTLVRPFVQREFGPGHNEALGPIFTVAGTVYAVFLAFVVVASWQAHQDAQSDVAEEASLLATLYRGSTAMDPRSGDRLRILIRQYTEAVLNEEWKTEAHGGVSSPTARAAGLEMFRVFGAMSPEVRRDYAVINQAQLATLAQFEGDRNKRILQAEEGLSPMIWGTAIINGVLMVLMCFFLFSDRNRPHLIMSAMLAVMIVVFLGVISVFARPFGGVLPLNPVAFTHSLAVYDFVDGALGAGGRGAPGG